MSSMMIGALGAAFSVALMLGLMVLLVTRPVSWVPAAGLALVAVWGGVVRFVRVAQPDAWAQRRWAWLAPYAVLVAAWIGLVGVFLPVPGALGERLVTTVVVAAVMCVSFLAVRLLARGAASLSSGACPSEYVAVPVPERASRP